MWSKIFVVILLVAIFLFCCSLAQDDDEKKQRCVTQCDKDIAKALCDNFITDMCDCAEKMPFEEHSPFFQCGNELTFTDGSDWKSLLEAICSKDESVEAALDLIDCWNDKMNEMVDEMENDDVYPEEHFACKKGIWKQGLEKTDCACQAEKGMVCEVGLPNTFG